MSLRDLWFGCKQPAGKPSINIQAAVSGLEVVGGRREGGESFLTYTHTAMSQSTPPEAGACPGACQSPRVAFPYWLLSPLSEAAPRLHLATSVSVSCRRRSGWCRGAWSSVLPLSLLLVTRCCFSPGLHHLTPAPALPPFLPDFHIFFENCFFSYFYSPPFFLNIYMASFLTPI